MCLSVNLICLGGARREESVAFHKARLALARTHGFTNRLLRLRANRRQRSRHLIQKQASDGLFEPHLFMRSNLLPSVPPPPLADLNNIKFSAYRTAMKLRRVQKALRRTYRVSFCWGGGGRGADCTVLRVNVSHVLRDRVFTQMSKESWCLST